MVSMCAEDKARSAKAGPAHGPPQLGRQAPGRGCPAGPQALGAAADPRPLPGMPTDTFLPRQQLFGG